MPCLFQHFKILQYLQSTDITNLWTNLAKLYLLQVGGEYILSFSFFSFFSILRQAEQQWTKKYQKSFKNCFIGGLVVVFFLLSTPEIKKNLGIEVSPTRPNYATHMTCMTKNCLDVCGDISNRFCLKPEQKLLNLLFCT